MIYWKTFLHSLQLPRKQAMFQLNRTGMDTALIYMFFFIFLISIPEFVHRVTGGEELYTNLFFFAIYFFIFYYLPLVMILLFSLSGVAYIYTKFASFVGRKLRFQIIWKLTAYSTTIPILLFTSLRFFTVLHTSAFVMTLIWTTVFIVIMILHFPRRKQRPVRNTKP